MICLQCPKETLVLPALMLLVVIPTLSLFIMDQLAVLRGDTHIRLIERLLYFIDSKKGQNIVVRGLLQSNRTLPGEDGKPFETAYALGAFTLKAYYPDGSPVRVRAARKRNLPGTSFKLDFEDDRGEGVILSVGDNYDWVAPDALFALEIDGETGTSANGSTE